MRWLGLAFSLFCAGILGRETAAAFAAWRQEMQNPYADLLTVLDGWPVLWYGLLTVLVLGLGLWAFRKLGKR